MIDSNVLISWQLVQGSSGIRSEVLYCTVSDAVMHLKIILKDDRLVRDYMLVLTEVIDGEVRPSMCPLMVVQTFIERYEEQLNVA